MTRGMPRIIASARVEMLVKFQKSVRNKRNKH